MKRSLRNKKVLVVGLGRSGTAAVRFLELQGAIVSTTDRQTDDQRPELFRGHDLIVVSPGVPLSLPGLREAKRSQTVILGEFGLAAEFLKSPLISVTGTNGKSTTSTLVARLLEEGGRSAALAGNIGRPLLEVVMESRSYDWVVAETSSFQLESVGRFHPRVSLLLNITPDHLDRYRSMADYARAKFRIFKEQSARDLLVYNAEDSLIAKGIRRARCRKLPFSSDRELKKGIYLQGEEIVDASGPRKENYPLGGVRLVGLHNAQNIMAAVGAARFCGVSPDSIRQTLACFEGLPHRMELVRELRGVRYYNDSKGTNVDAVVKTLAGLAPKRVILIAGGTDKGGSYRPLRRPLREKAKLLLLIGAATEKIERAVEGCTEVVKAGNLERAVQLAAERAMAGDLVLLSPACASYDQFKNFEERGEIFRRLVNAL